MLVEDVVLRSSDTCPSCLPRVIRLLDGFRASGSEEFIRDIDAFACACKDAWRARLDLEPSGSVAERLAAAYELLGRGVLGDPWWTLNGSRAIDAADLRTPVE